jgi:2-amino-4-hydroxy-6-hydroxymethyldihydropteridine diphosphokinase
MFGRNVMDLLGSPPLRGSSAYIGLGSNQGNSLETLRSALSDLRSLGHLGRVSPVYESDPVGLTDQPPFTNAVALLETPLEPVALLDGLLEIEARHGRVRTVRWGPRTLDLDLIAYEGVELETPRLVLPHPRASEREFVLRPLADIAPDVELGGLKASEWLALLPAQGVRALSETLV